MCRGEHPPQRQESEMLWGQGNFGPGQGEEEDGGYKDEEAERCSPAELRLAGTRGRCCLWKGTHCLGFCQLREGNSAFPPVLCVPSQWLMSWLTVAGPQVLFVPTVGAALLRGVELMITYPAFFCGPFH